MMAIALSLLLVCFLLMGAPLFTVILAAAMLGFYYADVDLSVIAIELYRIVDTPLLVALPLFTLAGYMLSESRASLRLLNLTQALIGWLPNGFAVVAIISCALFTAFTGASGVTIVALGALLLPSLIRAGYSERFSLGLMTSCGSLGLLLPPSLPLILYGIIGQQIIDDGSLTFESLFLAGATATGAMIIMLSIWVVWVNRNAPTRRQAFSGHVLWHAVKEAAWEIPLPIFILAGIFGGLLTVSEVAAFTALYVIIVQVFIYREISLKRFPYIVMDAISMVGGIMLILGVSLAFTSFLIEADVPTQILDSINELVDNKWTFLLLLNLLLLILGAILDIFSAIVIITPLILPAALQFGIHPVHLGIIFLANMQIGYFTPPVGMNLFIASLRFKKSVLTLYRTTLPFFFLLLIALGIITYTPLLLNLT